VTPYTSAFFHETSHGTLAAVHIPDRNEPVPEEVLATLPGPEAGLARQCRGYRQGQFVGGRLALRLACERIGVDVPPLLVTDRGAPALPMGLVGSISHKGVLAVGMVAKAEAGTLGVDLETEAPPRVDITRHVLLESERARIAPLSETERWQALLVCFSLKEAIYKALDPYVKRFVGFHEAEVQPDSQGNAAVTLHLKDNEGPFVVEALYERMRGCVLTSARIRPGLA
jgi:4'-phosphopantetheinyl transferase EntD